MNAVKIEKKLVEIAPDEEETLQKGQKICFFNSNGKKVGCGKVVGKKGKSRIFVKVKSLKALNKIEAGMTTNASTAKAGAKGATAAHANNQPPFRIWVDLGISLATPSVFNKILYSPPEGTEATPSTLWEKDQPESSAQGFNLQVGIPIGRFSLNPGIRLRTFAQSVVDTDYLKNQPNPYVTTSQKASATGIYTDFGFVYSRLSSFMVLNASAGLDIDNSSVDVTAKKKSDAADAPVTGDDTIISAKSSLMVISLRVGGSLEFVKMFGGRLALNLLLPVSASGSISGGVAEDEKRGLADADGDFKNALGHTKNSLAYEATIGVMLEF